MIVRRNVIFKSTSFNTTEPKEYFINDCCFGDDVARWLIQSVPGQEDFGWYLSFRINDGDYDMVIGYRPADEGESGDWMCTIERRAGLIRSILGARKQGIATEAAQAIHDALSSSSQITDIRWYTDDDYVKEENSTGVPIT